jgi:hypothetical protein
MAKTPETESELIEEGLRFLASGIDPRKVLQMVASGGKLIGFKQGSDCAMKAMDEALAKV